ncbi:facilitated trehalose transporter Tret1-like [Periplaneta americana]|uniref:facilitated trehalose transporter Tret1-like n=1 Tax=Periplaneta americana TaxID=6978 RepID=UPI0037E8F787
MTTLDLEKPPTCKEQPRTISRFREVLPQVLAISAANLIVVNVAVALFLSTLVIAEVYNPNANSTDHESNSTLEDGLRMDAKQASWFGSLPFFCQPLGSLASGPIIQLLGRRRALTLINIPYFLGCILVGTAPSVGVLFLANVVMGTTVGFTEAPINSYFGEICQPELRSILAGSAGIYYQVGMFLLFVLGGLTDWRTTALILSAMPLITMLLLCKVPESPIWLIAQGRIKDAEAALCWLRGWVEPSAVQEELEKLIQYYDSVVELSNQDNGEVKKRPSDVSPELAGLLPTNDIQMPADEKQTCEVTSHRPKSTRSVGSKVLEMGKLILQPESLRPLTLIFLFFTFYGFGGMPSIRPFLVMVLDGFYLPIETKWATVVIAATGFLSIVVLIAIVNRLGKRMIALTSTATCSACCLLLGLYSFLFIVPATRTGDQSYLVATWLPLLLFAILSFANTIQGQIPWLLVAEAFPFRTRGVVGGMAAASFYIMSFLAAKTFLGMDNALQLYGSFWFFGAVNGICFVYLYFQLPETEGKTLEEIERLFAGKKRRSK